MGCKYACVCGENCLKCTSFEAESYYGEAEDIYDEMHGTVDGKHEAAFHQVGSSSLESYFKDKDAKIRRLQKKLASCKAEAQMIIDTIGDIK